MGQRTKVHDWTGRYTNSFDAVGRTLLASDSFAKRITYGYDAVGQRVKMQEPDGGRFTYWYDGVGQITRLLNPFQENTTFAYDGVGRRKMQKLANSVRASYSYDAADRMTTLANVRADGTYVSRYDYAYDSTVNKTRVIEASGDRVTWSYDRTYQLTREWRSGANAYDTTYTYDAAQNRRLMIDSGTRTTYICDSANQLAWLVTDINRTTFSYDRSGNQTIQSNADQTRASYSWDCNNRLIGKKLHPELRATYVYSSNEQRISSATESSVSIYTWEKYSYLAEYISASDTRIVFTSQSIPPLASIISRHDSASSAFYHSDGVGTIGYISDLVGVVINSYVTTAYGVIKYSDTAIENNFVYKGEYMYMAASYDSSYYALTRYLAAINGRWISKDKMLYVYELNMYTYSANSPIRYADPFGLTPVCVPAECCCDATLKPLKAVKITNGKCSSRNKDGKEISVTITGAKLDASIDGKVREKKPDEKANQCEFKWEEKAVSPGAPGVPRNTWYNVQDYPQFVFDPPKFPSLSACPPEQPIKWDFTDCPGVIEVLLPANANSGQLLCIRITLINGCTGKTSTETFRQRIYIVNGKVVDNQSIPPDGPFDVHDQLLEYCKK